jgi:hypothetical protein
MGEDWVDGPLLNEVPPTEELDRSPDVAPAVTFAESHHSTNKGRDVIDHLFTCPLKIRDTGLRHDYVPACQLLAPEMVEIADHYFDVGQEFLIGVLVGGMERHLDELEHQVLFVPSPLLFHRCRYWYPSPRTPEPPQPDRFRVGDSYGGVLRVNLPEEHFFRIPGVRQGY